MAVEEGAHGAGTALDPGSLPGHRPSGRLSSWTSGWSSGPWASTRAADTGGRVATADADADDTADRWTTWLLAATAAVAIVGVVLLAVRGWTLAWYPVGDYGSLRLRVLDVGTDHTPLLGVYSRWGWNHPGPMLLYMLAPFVRLAGGDGNGLLLGTLVINALAIGATVWVAARAGRRVLALTGLVLTLLVVGLDPAWLMDAWNPYALIVPLFTATVAAWRAAVGDRVAAVVLVATASFTLQAHVLAGPPVALLLVVVAVGLGVRIWRGPDRRHDVRTVLLSLAVGVVLWIPPIIDQLTNSPGNLRQLVSFLLHGDETPVGWTYGARVLGRALSLPPLWITGGTSTARTPIPWALLALAVATAWALRRRWSSELALCAVAWAMVLAGLIGASRVTGVPFPYLFEWLRVVAAIVWLAAGTVLLSELVRRWDGARWAATALAGLTVVVLAGQIVAGPDLGALERSDRPLRDVYHVIDPTLEAVRQAPGPVVMTPTVYGIDTSVGIELLRRAEQQGLDLRFGPELAHVVGSQRTIDPADAASELVLASGPARGTYRDDPRYRMVADVEPLSPEEWAEYDELHAVDWANQTPNGPDQDDPRYQRYRELSDRAFENLSIFISTGPPPPG